MAKRSIVHFEIATASRAETAQFLAEVFGWEVQHVEEPGPYTTVTTGSIGGGLADTGDTYKPGDVVLYVESDDVESDLKRIEQAGGKRLSEVFPVGEFGEMAFFSDPVGNRFALWKALNWQPSGT